MSIFARDKRRTARILVGRLESFMPFRICWKLLHINERIRYQLVDAHSNGLSTPVLIESLPQIIKIIITVVRGLQPKRHENDLKNNEYQKANFIESLLYIYIHSLNESYVHTSILLFSIQADINIRQYPAGTCSRHINQTVSSAFYFFIFFFLFLTLLSELCALFILVRRSRTYVFEFVVFFLLLLLLRIY